MEFQKESLTPQEKSGKKYKPKSFAMAAFITPDNSSGGRARAGTTLKGSKPS